MMLRSGVLRVMRKCTLPTTVISGSLFSWSSFNASNTSATSSNTQYDIIQSTTLSNNIQLHICQGDLTKFDGDCIVNAGT